VRNQGEKASILHFTCHGRFDKEDGYYLQLYSAPSHPTLYRLSDLKVQSHIRLDDALVFVNACTSDVPTLNLGTIINLGELFFKSGADAFIGTTAPVPIPQAVRLADIFYKYLLQGMSVGISLHKAKMDMKAEKNPFYLFYCLYGNAYKRFRRVNQA
jgi:CHAT domain-containing protein